MDSLVTRALPAAPAPSSGPPHDRPDHLERTDQGRAITAMHLLKRQHPIPTEDRPMTPHQQLGKIIARVHTAGHTAAALAGAPHDTWRAPARMPSRRSLQPALLADVRRSSPPAPWSRSHPDA